MASKILIVDDEPHALKVLGLTLHRAGYEVVGALNGPEALDKISQSKPDLVILDVMMPEMNGFEVCQRIRATPETRHLPVIMLTALAGVDDKLAGFNAGVDDYVAKPVSMKELLARVKALLARTSRVAPTIPPPSKARTLAFIGVKGGVGTTTLAVNTAIAATQQGIATTLVDLHSQGGAVASQLGHHPRNTLNTLLKLEPEAVEASLVQNCILSHRTGLQILPAMLGPTEQPHELTEKHLNKILNYLANQADLLILDLEPVLNPLTQMLLRRANRMVLVAEPDSIALRMTRGWLGALDTLGIGGNLAGAVMVHHGKADTAYSKSELEEALGRELLALIVPAPEMCLYANKIGVPMLLQERDTLIEAQLKSLAPSLLHC